jgi:hypothetical protein
MREEGGPTHMNTTMIDAPPDWVVGQLPPQYADIARQIAALKEQARRYEGVAGVLWRTGPELRACLQDLFAALKYPSEIADVGSNVDLRVNLDQGRSLLVVTAGETERIDRRSPRIAQILRALQEDAGEQDRVVLAGNLFADRPIESRPDDQVTVEALRLIQGLGANFVPTTTLFGIWKASLVDLAQAQRSVMNLYAMDGGVFR